MEQGRTFSESWHRVAGQKIQLRPGVQVQRQQFRGERWIVLQNPLANQFFRLRPEAYEFVSRLCPDKTVEEVWQECLDRFPDTAPGQEAVVQLLAQLYHANLLQYELAPDAEQLFQRQRKRQQQELGLKWLNIMFMRFPLLDPDRFLVKTLPYVNWLIGPIGILLWLVVVGLGVKTAMDNSTALLDHTQGVLAPSNILWLYLGMVIIKTIHEFGHAYFCRKFGGEVHVMGVMLMIFTPVPFVDATASWGFRSRKQRVLVGCAGMIVELFVAAIAAMVWANTQKGDIINSVAFNMMFIASVSTLLFNLNPLMRFDGYYIMSDLLEIPNLNQRSMMQLIYGVERHAFGIKTAQSQAHTRSEAGWLTLYGISSLIYRTIVFAGIVWFLADKWLLLGLIMAAVCLFTWLVVPTYKFIKYLASSPKLERTRAQAVGVVAVTAAVLILLLAVIPFPHYFRASGVVQAKEWSQIIAEAPGEVVEVLAKPGQPIKKGQPIIRLENPELDIQLAQAQAKQQEVEARIRNAMQRDLTAVEALKKRLDSMNKFVERIRKEQQNLTVRARHDGIWVAPGVEDIQQRMVKRGSPLGLLVNPKSFEFSVTVLQEDVDRIFRPEIPQAEVRLPGTAEMPLGVGKLRAIPGEQMNLPTPALGWQGGGDVAINTQERSGRMAAEPFFAVTGEFSETPEIALLHGQTGKIRFKLENEPLVPRWIRRLGQLLQKRFQF
ncbi:MAG TPA: biotin/lipoyl-binding protein [Verrucomicrobiae bacterium]